MLLLSMRTGTRPRVPDLVQPGSGRSAGFRYRFCLNRAVRSTTNALLLFVGSGSAAMAWVSW
jgi:hypothetical protein